MSKVATGTYGRAGDAQRVGKASAWEQETRPRPIVFPSPTHTPVSSTSGREFATRQPIAFSILPGSLYPAPAVTGLRSSSMEHMERTWRPGDSILHYCSHGQNFSAVSRVMYIPELEVSAWIWSASLINASPQFTDLTERPTSPVTSKRALCIPDTKSFKR